MTQISAIVAMTAVTALLGTVVTHEMSPNTNGASGSIMNNVGHSLAPDIAVTRQAGDPETTSSSAAPAYTWGDAVRDVAISEAVGFAADEATQQLTPVLGEAFGARTGGYLSSSVVGVVSSLAYGKGLGSALLGAAMSAAKQVGLDQLRETSAGSVVASAIETAEAVHSIVDFVGACTQSGPACLAGAPTQIRTLHALGRSWRDTADQLAAPSCTTVECALASGNFGWYESSLDLGRYGQMAAGDLALGWYPTNASLTSTYRLRDTLTAAGYLTGCELFSQGCNAATEALEDLARTCRQRCTRDQLASACAADDAACKTVVGLIRDRDTIPCAPRSTCPLVADGGRDGARVALSPEQLLTTLRKLVASGALPDDVSERLRASLPDERAAATGQVAIDIPGVCGNLAGTAFVECVISGDNALIPVYGWDPDRDEAVRAMAAQLRAAVQGSVEDFQRWWPTALGNTAFGRWAQPLIDRLGWHGFQKFMVAFTNGAVGSIGSALELVVDARGIVTDAGRGIKQLALMAATDFPGTVEIITRTIVETYQADPASFSGTVAWTLVETIGAGGITTLGKGSKLGSTLRDIAQNPAALKKLLARRLQGDTLPEALARCASGRCGAMCFAAGTPVRGADGPRAIETIEPGDRVWSRDEATGELRLQPVTRVFRRTAELLHLELAAADGTREVLRVTAEHPFWVEDVGWIPAGELAVDLRIATSGDVPVTVVGLASTGEIADVYNLEVAETHTYFAGALEAWVHNTCVVLSNATPLPHIRPAARNLFQELDALADGSGFSLAWDGKTKTLLALPGDQRAASPASLLDGTSIDNAVAQNGGHMWTADHLEDLTGSKYMSLRGGSVVKLDNNTLAVRFNSRTLGGISVEDQDEVIRILEFNCNCRVVRGESTRR